MKFKNPELEEIESFLLKLLEKYDVETIRILLSSLDVESQYKVRKVLQKYINQEKDETVL